MYNRSLKKSKVWNKRIPFNPMQWSHIIGNHTLGSLAGLVTSIIVCSNSDCLERRSDMVVTNLDPIPSLSLNLDVGAKYLVSGLNKTSGPGRDQTRLVTSDCVLDSGVRMVPPTWCCILSPHTGTKHQLTGGKWAFYYLTFKERGSFFSE